VGAGARDLALERVRGSAGDGAPAGGAWGLSHPRFVTGAPRSRPCAPAAGQGRLAA
jgi:hypothetical protein